MTKFSIKLKFLLKFLKLRDVNEIHIEKLKFKIDKSFYNLIFIRYFLINYNLNLKFRKLTFKFKVFKNIYINVFISLIFMLKYKRYFIYYIFNE